MKLYSFFRSSAAYRVRIALSLKGVDYETITLNLPKGDHRQPGFVALNPHRTIPVIDDDGTVLMQSLAIIEYLDSRYPDSAADSGRRGRARACAGVRAGDRVRDPSAQQPARAALSALRARARRGAREQVGAALDRRIVPVARGAARRVAPAVIASATSSRSPTCSSCRRCTTHAASAATSGRSRPWCASRTRCARCPRSRARRPSCSPTRNSRRATAGGAQRTAAAPRLAHAVLHAHVEQRLASARDGAERRIDRARQVGRIVDALAPTRRKPRRPS